MPKKTKPLLKITKGQQKKRRLQAAACLPRRQLQSVGCSVDVRANPGVSSCLSQSNSSSVSNALPAILASGSGGSISHTTSAPSRRLIAGNGDANAVNTRRTRNAKAMATARANESYAERRRRLRRNALATGAARASETVVQRSQRQRLHAANVVAARASETAIKKTLRNKRNAVAMAVARASESEARRSERRGRDAAATAAATASESESRRSERRSRNAVTTTAARAAESETRRSERRGRDAVATAAARDAESETRRSVRQGRDAAATAAARASESEDRRLERRGRNAAATALSRASESVANRATRLEQVAQCTASRRGLSRVSSSTWSLKAFNYAPGNNYAQNSYVQIGSMSSVCCNCNAKKWAGEPVGMCCSNGKVSLPPLIDPPQPLRLLLTGTHSLSRGFLQDIRHFNCAFQMTSFGSNYAFEGGFMPTFKVQGQVYHLIGSLMPANSKEPQFLQVYFMQNRAQQASRRNSFAFPKDNTHGKSNSHHIRARNYSIALENRLDLILELQNMLHSCNRYIQDLKYALESAPTHDFSIVIDADKQPTGEHAGRYNAPTSNEVAILLTGDQQSPRDIVIRYRDDKLQRISETHRSYDALQYPLLFPHGEDGYHFGIEKTTAFNSENQLHKTLTCKDFYSFRFMIRANSFNHLHRSQDLFSQYATDMCAKMESERLCFIKRNQKKLRCDSYIHLRDGMKNDVEPSNLGKVCILPSTFTGGPRYMHEKTQDAMTIVRHYGRPDLFITFTCNPKWKEIEEELLPGQSGTRRHDLAARVFRLKLLKLMDIIKLGQIFGPVRGDLYTIEWQKRGLPHAHILIWLTHKINSNDIDKIISAELPVPSTDRDLYIKVKAHMIHGPCGPGFRTELPCVSRNKRCTKKFPRKFTLETQTGNDGYPLYRRRRPEDGGFTALIGKHEIDNRWVVPYCPLLLSIFDAHINVEFCNSVKCIKYICKYVNKGSDAASFGIGGDNDRDEVTQYLVGRYIGSSEAFWRIFGFPIHDRNPAIVKLAVHLENGQRTYFTSETAASLAETPKETTLTGFFKLCQNDVFARTLLYHQVPAYFTWNGKFWCRRKQGQPVDGFPGVRFSACLGRVYTIPPHQHECFHLRMLLHEVIGPTSFDDLKTLNQNLWSTFREACMARGMLEDDSRWDATLQEIASTQTARHLRVLFARLLMFCSISDPHALWLKYRDMLSDDILQRTQRLLPDTEVVLGDDIYNRALIDLEDRLLTLGGPPLPSLGLPQTFRTETEGVPTLVVQETSYSTLELSAYVQEMKPKLLPDQFDAYNAVTENVFHHRGGVFFLDAPGGTGKTFLNKLILAAVREIKFIAIAVASSGIAATLLPGGRTAHSTFKLPLDLTSVETPMCDIKKDSHRAELLRRCHLIVWDECTMVHKGAIEALDRSLQDLRDNSRTMGGVTVLFSGDFRQTLPVIPKGTRADQVRACLKTSTLWSQVKTLKLTTNMRAKLNGDAASAKFADDLLMLGAGQTPADNDHYIHMQTMSFCLDNREELMNSVFPDLIHNYHNHTWLSERVILAPKNDSVKSINSQLLSRLPGDLMTFKSVDSNADPSDAVQYPIEFLNAQDPSGMPSHILELKEGAPVILLRNISPPKLCNGTRLVVDKMTSNIIYATILSGCGVGEDVLIPKITLTTTGVGTPYSLKRTQFPLRAAFAMSINKSQGQTLSVAGLYLKESCFSHGQLYVGCSRVGSSDSLFAYAPGGKTKNIVYGEVL